MPGPSSLLRPHSEGGAEVVRGTVEGQHSKLGLLYASLNIIVAKKIRVHKTILHGICQREEEGIVWKKGKKNLSMCLMCM